MKRVSIITLGVKNLTSSRLFFEKLFDWKPKDEDTESIVFFNMGGWMLALFPWDQLAKDATIKPEENGFSGISLAHNVREKEEVATMLSKAVELGGELIKPAQDVFWGGHSGYFKDLDGHLWEVAFNPFTKTLEDGTLDLPKI